jgi:hypothetical protein
MIERYSDPKIVRLHERVAAFENANRAQFDVSPRLAQTRHDGSEMSDSPTRDEIAAQIAASEARAAASIADVRGDMREGFANIRTEFAALRGEMREGFARTDERLGAVERSTAGIKTTIIATVIPTAIAAVAVIIAILAYGQAWFGIGINSRDTIRAIMAEMRQAPVVQPTK